MARILIIDDDDDIRAVLEQALKAAGYEVMMAADGEEGMKHLGIAGADLVLTDLFMPNREGIETIRQLRREQPKLPVIAMSGKSAADVMLAIARKLGVTAVLQKPFAVQELLTAVSRALQPAAQAVCAR